MAQDLAASGIKTFRELCQAGLVAASLNNGVVAIPRSQDGR